MLFSRLAVRCPLDADACPWKGAYAEMANHVRTECTKALVQCSTCHAWLERAQWNGHAATVCRQCRHCSARFVRDALAAHEDQCPEETDLCEHFVRRGVTYRGAPVAQGCAQRIKRAALADHTRDTCAAVLERCEFCDSLHARGLLHAHLRACAQRPPKTKRVAETKTMATTIVAATAMTTGITTAMTRASATAEAATTTTITTTTAESKTPCPFAKYGCPAWFASGDGEAHARLAAPRHVQLLAAQVERLSSLRPGGDGAIGASAILLVGGTRMDHQGNGVPNLNIGHLDLKTGRYSVPHTLCFERHVCSVAALADRVYIIGGRGSMEVWHVDAGSKVVDARLRIAHSSGRLLSCGGKIYALGASGEAALDCYDPASDAWSVCVPIPRPRTGASVVASHGKLYVVGGKDPRTDAFTLPVDCYDPATQTWSSPTTLSVGRIAATAVHCGSGFFLMGGCASNAHNPKTYNVVDSVLHYNVLENKWSVPKWNLLVPRAGFAAQVFQGCIYIFGGFDSNQKIVEGIQFVNFGAGTWFNVTWPPCPYIYLGSALLL